jgi:hypothetical protein
MSLSRKHVEFLLSTLGTRQLHKLERIRYRVARHVYNYNPDEVFFQTVLRNQFPLSEIFNHRFVELIAEGHHAKTLTPLEFERLYRYCVSTDTLFCIRKVSRHTQWDICKFLGSQGVVNYAL